MPGLVVMTDVCMCEYTDHGHCGILAPSKAGGPGQALQVDNDATLPLLAREAVAHAQAGADIVAPSDMMDGRVAAIREAARPARLPGRAHPLLRREVRGRVLRPVPRRGGERAGGGARHPQGPQGLPDGPGQLARGAARGGARRGRGRRHGDGEAGGAVPRHRAAGARPVRPADRRVPRVRRVRDDQGGRRARAGSTRIGSCSRRCSAAAAPAPTWCSPTTPSTRRSSWRGRSVDLRPALSARPARTGWSRSRPSRTRPSSAP